MTPRTGQVRNGSLQRRSAGFRCVLVGLAVAVLLGSAPMRANANEYESEQAGHPLRVAAYVLHPVGVILENVLFRPAHWVVQWEPFRTLFGHYESN